ALQRVDPFRRGELLESFGQRADIRRLSLGQRGYQLRQPLGARLLSSLSQPQRGQGRAAGRRQPVGGPVNALLLQPLQGLRRLGGRQRQPPAARHQRGQQAVGGVGHQQEHRVRRRL